MKRIGRSFKRDKRRFLQCLRSWTYSGNASPKIINKVSSGPPCEDGNARFTVVPFKASSDQVWIIKYKSMFIILKTNYFLTVVSLQSDLRISTERISWRNKQNQTFFKRRYLTHNWSDAGFTCTVEIVHVHLLMQDYLKLHLEPI